MNKTQTHKPIVLTLDTCANENVPLDRLEFRYFDNLDSIICISNFNDFYIIQYTIKTISLLLILLLTIEFTFS